MAGVVASGIKLTGGDLAGNNVNPTVNPVQFAVGLLQAIGAPVNNTNIASIVGWNAAEGSTAQFNPLDTTYVIPHTSPNNFNGVGVQNYSTEQAGIYATMHTLLHSSPSFGYSGIVNALKNSQPIGPAIAASSWTGSHTDNFTAPTATGKYTGGLQWKPIGIATGVTGVTPSGKQTGVTSPSEWVNDIEAYGSSKGAIVLGAIFILVGFIIMFRQPLVAKVAA
jgi:hypothetical protein